MPHVHVVVEVPAECHCCRQCRRCSDRATWEERYYDPQKASFVRESYLDWKPAYETAIRRQVSWIETKAQDSMESTRGILAMHLSLMEKLELLHFVAWDLDHVVPVRFNVIKLPLTGSDAVEDEEEDVVIDRRCDDTEDHEDNREGKETKYQNETQLAINGGEVKNSKRRKVLKRTDSSMSTMDPELWGNLPHSVALEIYKRLPLRNFFKLRGICKDWNRVACERRGFTDPIPKPYFLLVTLGEKTKDYVHGMLTYNVSPGRWIFKMNRLYMRGLLVRQYEEPFSVEGLIFEGCKILSPRPRGLEELIQTQVLAPYGDRKLGLIVADMHTGRRIHTPRAPEPFKSSVIGMVVDTSRRPYTYKLIMGSCDVGTQIYDSQSMTWDTKPSLLVRGTPPRTSNSPKSCVHCDGVMYIWSELDEILVYSLEEDKWTTLEPPPRHAGTKISEALGTGRAVSML